MRPGNTDCWAAKNENDMRSCGKRNSALIAPQDGLRHKLRKEKTVQIIFIPRQDITDNHTDTVVFTIKLLTLRNAYVRVFSFEKFSRGILQGCA